MTTEVHVALIQDTETRQRIFRVRVTSNVRKGLRASNDIPANSDRVEYRVAIAAAACAEHQNEKYGDRHNPDYIAKVAVEAYREVLQKLEKSGGSEAASTLA